MSISVCHKLSLTICHNNVKDKQVWKKCREFQELTESFPLRKNYFPNRVISVTSYNRQIKNMMFTNCNQDHEIDKTGLFSWIYSKMYFKRIFWRVIPPSPTPYAPLFPLSTYTVKPFVL